MFENLQVFTSFTLFPYWMFFWPVLLKYFISYIKLSIWRRNIITHERPQTLSKKSMIPSVFFSMGVQYHSSFSVFRYWIRPVTNNYYSSMLVTIHTGTRNGWTESTDFWLVTGDYILYYLIHVRRSLKYRNSEVGFI